MFKKKLKSYGLKAKQRTKAEIDQDYTNNAVQAGHKTRVIAQLQLEIDQHVQNLICINEEAMKLPPEAPKVDLTPATNAVAAVVS